MCRAVNHAGRDLVTANPGRFGFFASLRLPDVEAALREIAHAFDDLGVDGVVLETNINGEYLGSPKFAPVFSELKPPQGLGWRVARLVKSAACRDRGRRW